MDLDRRRFLRNSASGLALSSLATGLPLSILLRPRPGRAEPDPLAAGPGRMLILFTSSLGDPINANVPGTYGPGAEAVIHPDDPRMQPTELRLGTRTYTAAKPWADLPQWILDQTVFFHHATYTPVHGDQQEVMRLMGASASDDMLVSVLARHLAPRQGSIQSDPVSMGAKGAQLLTSQGRLLADVKPRSIRRALGRPQGPLADLQSLRDRDIDRIYNLYREHGTSKDVDLLDAWARSRDQARSLSDALLQRLELIDGNGPDDQILSASVLAAMNITPVMTVRGEFGGDNHNDEDLARESEETESGVARMGRLMEQIEALRTEGALRHEVIVGTYNVFGRDLRKKGRSGRDHNRGHHVAVLMGPGLRPGVVGGLEMTDKDMRCTSIDSATGAPGGDIPFEETLGSFAKTLGRALQIPDAVLDVEIEVGKPVLSALA